MKIKSLLNKNIRKFIWQQENKSGNYSLVKKGKIDLTLTENPLGCSLLVKKTFLSLGINLDSYPKTVQKQKIQKDIADRFDINKNMIVFGNGSEALIDLVCRVFLNQNERVIIPETTTFLFKRAAMLAGGEPVLIPMKAGIITDLTKIKNELVTKSKLVFMANPNNPTGELIDKNKILKLVKEFPNTLFVIDEANIEFSKEKNSLITKAEEPNNIIVLRTFSKAFGLAGLRIGFLVTNFNLAYLLNQVNQVFGVNSLAFLAAEIAIKDKMFLRKTKEFSNRQRLFLTSELKKLGFEVCLSKSNNLLVRIPNVIKPSVFNKKLLQTGVSVIPGSYFGGLDDSYFRINLQTPIINQKFIKILKKIIKEENDKRI